jgi:hypothetical protein
VRCTGRRCECARVQYEGSRFSRIGLRTFARRTGPSHPRTGPSHPRTPAPSHRTRGGYFATPLVLVFVLLLIIIATPVLGQDDDPARDPGFGRPPPPGAGDNAQLLRDVSAAASRTREAKAAFVTALRSFAEGLSGTYGDEGPRIRTALADMRAALKRWDDAIGGFRGALNGGRKRGCSRRVGNGVAGSRLDARRCRSVSARHHPGSTMGRGHTAVGPHVSGSRQASGVGARSRLPRV